MRLQERYRYLYMKDKNKKKDEFVIINKFKENSSVDVKKSIERVFKVFYNLQIKKIQKYEI